MTQKIRNKSSLFSICHFLMGIFVPFLCQLAPSTLYSQSHKRKETEVVAFSIGYGMLSFYGDVGKNSLAGAYSFIRGGYSISTEKYLNRNFSISLNALAGKVARDEKSTDNLIKLNFESSIMQLGINGTVLMAGKQEQPVIPYISSGISFLLFDPHGDLHDKNGSFYYYWNDGSIHDGPQTSKNYFSPVIGRDYTYETKLTDSVSEYSRSTFSLPLTAGFKMKLSSRLDANIAFTYNMAFSDYIDNVKTSGNDAYLFSATSLTFHIFKLAKQEKEKISTVDFASIDNSDSDKDGILDVNDACPNGPKDVKVNSKGCPLDSDADGVPDYLDKELHSKIGASVDISGVELTKARMSEIQKKNDIKASTRKESLSQTFNEKPSAEFMKQVEQMQKEKSAKGKTPNSVIPLNLRIADWNKDGIISMDEIAKTIDSFFDGSIDFSSEQIHKLVDFFFEQ